MSCTIQSNSPLYVSSNEQNFDSLIKWVETIPVSHVSQDYFALAIVIQQEVEPIITKKEPQIIMEGNVLSAEITQSKSFNNQLKLLPSYLQDPAFLSCLNSSEIPLTESILVTRSEEKVNMVSRVIFIICRTNNDKSVLESMCQGAIQELIRTKDSMTGSFNFFAQALIKDKSPTFPLLTGSSEPSLLGDAQDLISLAVKQSELTLEPREGLILEKHFDHGENEETNTRLSVALEDDEIITTQKKKTDLYRFTDLRYKSEVSFTI